MGKQGKRFNLGRKPHKPRWFLKIVEHVASLFFCWFTNAHVKIDKEVRKLKRPYIILSTHSSFADFPMLAKGIMPKTTGWVVSIEEFRRGNIMFGIGSIPKRRFTPDLSTTKNILYFVKKLKRSCAIYPEARFSLCGITEQISPSIGKLCKKCNVSVVLFKSNGSYVNSPQWNKHPYRRCRQEAKISLLFTKEQIKTLSAEEIQQTIEQVLQRDEYQWQFDNKIHTKCKKRANGLHKILYKCPSCKTEFKTNSSGIHLWCEHCGAKWEMDTLSRLHGLNTDKGFEHIPDWYNWERNEVKQEVINGSYHFEDDVRIEDCFHKRIKFINFGHGKVVHDKNGFEIKGTTLDGEPFNLIKPILENSSLHIEYNFIKRGPCFEISNEKGTYFFYLQNNKNAITKLHFATEELYKYYVLNEQ